ncbi:proton channel OtopLc-like [Branchiostoma floridae]|uniref:Proton channel OtopLc-like n=1 Tax=Branchiostoma floridae TaxID=7739 RepID=A0A9J7LZ93_BRAFL|nr:proton channel OtopLc-like [Branchiostoma floridae]
MWSSEWDQPPAAETGPTGTFTSDNHGEHPMAMQNYLARFVSIICLFCLVTAGIVLSVGNSTVDPMDNPVEFTGTSNTTPTPPHMEPIGPEKLERFLYIAMIAGLVWMTITLCCPSVLITQTTNHHGCSGRLDTSVLHLLGATLIFAVGAAFLPLINFVGFLSNAECYRHQVWGKNEYEWLLYQICHFLFIFMQPLFLFKFVQHGGQLKFCRGLSHFAIMWLMGTNISLWFHGLVEESNEDEAHEFSFVVIPSSGQTLAKTIRPSSVIICPASSGLQGVLPEIRPFLHPFALEYSLISAGLFLNLWNRIGKKRNAQQAGRSIEQTTSPQQTTSLRILVVGGLIMGLIIVLGLAATIVYQSSQLNELGIKTDVCNTSHITTIDKALDTTFGVYYGYSIAVSFIMLTGCLIVLCCPLIALCHPTMPVEVFGGHDPGDAQHENMDRIWIETALLISSVGGVFLINGFGIAASVGLSNYDGCGVISRWYMADCVLDVLHCIAQLLLIIGALHQQWDGTKWRTFVFSCLFIINLGLWGKDLYEVKNIATTALSQVYFGTDVWSVVIHIAFPLCIFFRLHSAASLFPLMMKSCRINNSGTGVNGWQSNLGRWDFLILDLSKGSL